MGSGFIISDDGYILTNNHVVDGADEIVVRFSDRLELTAEVIGQDPLSDMALIKVAAEGLPVVQIGRSRDLKVGEWVLAIGSPFGFDYSVTFMSFLFYSLPVFWVAVLAKAFLAIKFNDFLADPQVANNRKALAIHRKKLEVGQISALPVLQVQARLIGSEVLLLRVRNQRLAQRTDLHLALGGSF